MNLLEKVQWMVKHGFTCGQIARIVNCSDSTIIKWVKGTSKISKRMEESIEYHLSSFIQSLNDIWSDLNE